MNERNAFSEIKLPPSRICEVCRNRMLDVCIEECAVNKSFVHLDPDPNRSLVTLPSLSLNEFRELNGKAKGEWIFYRQNKIISFLEGKDDGHYNDNSRGRRISKNLQEQDLLPCAEERNASLSDWKECENIGKRVLSMASEAESKRTESTGVQD